ncbi:3-hydroxyacyl-CoA dehydrogenase family protein [Nocardia halotolerans]|uniref:3-hydroxyacyl-CoA dehydrogenase family protein n=1 Tax=Nocardia halotolerans TaxID=1755878 RepID=A0ABV8VEY2_9NOCA
MSVPQNHLERPVAVIGAGTLGRRIALMFATRGGAVRIVDPSAETGAAAVEFVHEQLPGVAAAVSGGSPGTAEYVPDQAAAVRGAWLVIEAVPEVLELKKKIFAQLDTQADADAIVSSNSSSYASRLFTGECETKDRMLNTHFYMPPGSTVLDVMSDGHTTTDVLDFVLETFPEYGLHPFLCRKESTGFIFNRIWAAVKREALEVVYEGVSVPEDVDEMFALNFGTKAGPFRLMDQVGLDVVLDIEQHYVQENPNLPRGPVELLREYVDAGKLGVKTGEGFYDDYPEPKQG